MKRFVCLALAVLMVSAIGMAQKKDSQPAANDQAAATAGPKPPQAKSQGEFKAYQDAATKPTPEEQEQAAEEFAVKYPESELKGLLMLNAMRSFQNANNADKTVEVSRKVLEMDPNNPEALVTLASILAQRTRATDLDHEERMAEAASAAKKALQTVDTNLMVPPNVPVEKVEAAKNAMKSMAYSALGMLDMTNKNWPSAEQNLQQAVQISAAEPDPVAFLRLAVVRSEEKKYPEAMDAANKAMQYAPAGSQVANLAKAQHDRLQQMMAGGGAAGAGAAGTSAPATAPATSAPAGAGTPSPAPSPSPTTP